MQPKVLLEGNISCEEELRQRAAYIKSCLYRFPKITIRQISFDCTFTWVFLLRKDYGRYSLFLKVLSLPGIFEPDGFVKPMRLSGVHADFDQTHDSPIYRNNNNENNSNSNENNSNNNNIFIHQSINSDNY